MLVFGLLYICIHVPECIRPLFTVVYWIVCSSAPPIVDLSWGPVCWGLCLVSFSLILHTIVRPYLRTWRRAICSVIGVHMPLTLKMCLSGTLRGIPRERGTGRGLWGRWGSKTVYNSKWIPRECEMADKLLTFQ